MNNSFIRYALILISMSNVFWLQAKTPSEFLRMKICHGQGRQFLDRGSLQWMMSCRLHIINKNWWHKGKSRLQRSFGDIHVVLGIDN